MKRYRNLYHKIYDMDNLRLAHKNAKRGKGWYKEVRRVDENLDEYLTKLQKSLINHTYKTSEYVSFERKDSDKIRKIYKLPYFPDRICQWAILQVIEPYLIKHFTNDTYSAIPNRGIHKAVKKLRYILNNDSENCKYCLKIDARHYYQCINHKLLENKYMKLFDDDELMWLLSEIINSINTASLDDLSILYPEFTVAQDIGIPIGNYLSQYDGNFYLSSFDHYAKEVLKIKYYFRYMDDICIFSNSKEFLHKIFYDINNYFKNDLNLVIKNNWQIFPTFDRGLDFLGYRFFKDFTLLRKSTCLAMKRRIRAIHKRIKRYGEITYSDYCSINSYKGWLKWCNSYRISNKYIHPLEKYLIDYYNNKIKSS